MILSMDLSVRFGQFEKNSDCILNFVLFGSVFARIDNHLNCLCETVPINHTLWLIQIIFWGVTRVACDPLRSR